MRTTWLGLFIGPTFLFLQGPPNLLHVLGAVVEPTPDGSQKRLIVVSTVSEKTGVTYNEYRTTPVVVY